MPASAAGLRATSGSGPAAPVIVVGRYAGTVGVLTEILTAGGVTVHDTAALDREPAGDGLAAVDRLLGATPDAVVVVTVAPSDHVVDAVLHRIPPDRVVAVTWHPVDERPPLPDAVRVVPAGRIHAELAAAVSAIS